MATPSFHRPLRTSGHGTLTMWRGCVRRRSSSRTKEESWPPRDFVTCPDFQATVGNGPSPFSFRSSLEHCVGDFNQQGRF